MIFSSGYRLVVVGLLSLVALGVARADLRWSGALSPRSPEGRFYLADSANAASGRWVRRGENFAGCTVDRYEVETKTLVLRKGAEELRLTMASDPTPAQAAEVDPPEDPADLLAKMSDEDLKELGFVRLQPGDTVWKVARAHGLTIARVLELNPGLEPTRLRVGQILRWRAED